MVVGSCSGVSPAPEYHFVKRLCIVLSANRVTTNRKYDGRNRDAAPGAAELRDRSSRYRYGNNWRCDVERESLKWCGRLFPNSHLVGMRKTVASRVVPG